MPSSSVTTPGQMFLVLLIILSLIGLLPISHPPAGQKVCVQNQKKHSQNAASSSSELEVLLQENTMDRRLQRYEKKMYFGADSPKGQVPRG